MMMLEKNNMEIAAVMSGWLIKSVADNERQNALTGAGARWMTVRPERSR